jgi:hypothetical protein
MKKSPATILGMFLLLCLFLPGCTGTPVTFRSSADQNYDASKGRMVTAGSCGFQLLLFIPINVNDRQKQAYEELLVQAGSDHYVTNIKVQEKWYYAFVGTVYCTEMEATAYPKMPSASLQPVQQ